MRFKILAMDYDGTLASGEQVSGEAIQRLGELKASGRVCILVTGRELKDLIRVFPQLTIFDRVVAENGAVVYCPDTGDEKALAEPPPMAFIKDLQLAGIQPLSVGKVIVATWEPHQQSVLEVIKRSGIERQVIFNKGAVMILPPGINKASGLKAALHDLNLSYHNVVAAGDAENDSHLLQMAECGVAVSNALPALKQLADWTATYPDGRAIEELMDKLLTNDLAELAPLLKRHGLRLGQYADGTAFKISPYGSALLVTGPSMSGKTTLAAAFLEQLLDRQYQFCLIDPEGDYGDYEGLPGVVRIGDASHVPELAAVAALLKNPEQSCLVCLVAIPFAERAGFFRQLAELLIRVRQELSHPHWLILDEVHHLFQSGGEADQWPVTEHFENFMMLTTSPDLVNPVLVRRVDTIITTGEQAQQTLRQFANLTGRLLPESGTDIPLMGQALVWEGLQQPFLIDTALPAVHLQRHKRKYAQGDLKGKSFYFNGPKGLQLRAKNLSEFIQLAGMVDDPTWNYHLQRHDYSAWFGNAISDPELATAALLIEADGTDSGLSREAIKKLIEERYAGPADTALH